MLVRPLGPAGPVESAALELSRYFWPDEAAKEAGPVRGSLQRFANVKYPNTILRNWQTDGSRTDFPNPLSGSIPTICPRHFPLMPFSLSFSGH